MAEIRSICVFCGSSRGKDTRYAEAARTLGKTMAERGIRLVFGAGSIGLMGELARAVMAHGGAVTGVIPRFLLRREVVFDAIDDLIVTDDLHARKKIMFERSDAFVALPGGIGTLEETVEQMTWAQLGRHEKPIVLVDVAGFWRPLIRLFEHMESEAFIRGRLDFHVVDRVEDAVDRVVEIARPLAPGAVVAAVPLDRL